VLEALDKSRCKTSELKVEVNQNKDFIDTLKELYNHLKKLTLIGVSRGSQPHQ
jgi:hypothetical protein